MILRVKYLHFEIFIVVNRPCFVPSSSKRDLVTHVVLQKKVLYLERLLRGLLDLR